MTFAKWSLLLFTGLVATSPVCAQSFQNAECYFLVGPQWLRSQRLPGTDITFEGTTRRAYLLGMGYQVARFSSAGLWVEMTPASFSAGSAFGNDRAFLHTFFAVYVPTARLMVPVASRVSVYGSAGYGAGWFYYPVLSGGATPSVMSNTTWHGVFAFSGGVDYRLNRWISFRAETRDYVTGRGLSGSVGRHHPIPAAGVAFHIF